MYQQTEQPGGVSYPSSIEIPPTVWIPSTLFLISTLFLLGARVKLSNLLKKIPLPGQDLVPTKEVDRIEEVLSQLAIICEADRVSLGMFHNGLIGIRGAHYERMCVLAGYSAPGVKPLPELNKDIRAEALIQELTPLFDKGGDLKLFREEVPEGCSLYLQRRDIHSMWNRILYCGNIETAVISFHWCRELSELPIPKKGCHGDKMLEGLISELEVILRTTRQEEVT